MDTEAVPFCAAQLLTCLQLSDLSKCTDLDAVQVDFSQTLPASGSEGKPFLDHLYTCLMTSGYGGSRFPAEIHISESG